MNLNSQIENKGNILIVDDLLENLQLLSEALLKLGYTVRSVTSGRMALKTVKVKRPDVILLDVKMPEMDGYQGEHPSFAMSINTEIIALPS
ncbi:response regulator [Microcoleus sp. herbarium5]|uniref:response regulator n=1 Tax=Microcoleus sp. herbarium5 TaxID=3055434 RepID=UPI002FD7143C